jgi:hypothetical protein
MRVAALAARSVTRAASTSAPAPPALTAVALEARLRASPSLSPLAHVRCVDTSGGCGAFFSVLAVSEQFERMPPVSSALVGVKQFFVCSLFFASSGTTLAPLLPPPFLPAVARSPLGDGCAG